MYVDMLGEPSTLKMINSLAFNKLSYRGKSLEIEILIALVYTKR